MTRKFLVTCCVVLIGIAAAALAPAAAAQTPPPPPPAPFPKIDLRDLPRPEMVGGRPVPFQYCDPKHKADDIAAAERELVNRGRDSDLAQRDRDRERLKGPSGETEMHRRLHQREVDRFDAVLKDARGKVSDLEKYLARIRAIPVIDCLGARTVSMLPGTEPKPPAQGFGPRPAPINVGSNSAVGSGARLRQKAVGTALNIIGGLAGLKGGGGSSGPPVANCRVSDKETTVFTDPETGVALRVAAKRAGDRILVFADVDKSPDKGTFQTAYLQDDAATQAPRDVSICDLWGEWSLSVSWTKTSYVNDQAVSREEGGWSKSGAFSVPGGGGGVQGAPLWRKLGFSNASNGARQIAMTYNVPKLAPDHPLGVIVHVTRPAQDPVMTAPFAMLMREGPKGFTFEAP